MDNPIPVTARGWVYVVGIVLGSILTVTAVVLTVLGLDQWQPIVTAVSGAVALVSSMLARANLTGDAA